MSMIPLHNKGFAMLFTVLLVSLILTIAVGISNITLKQSVLSNLAKDSGIAFYQADAAVECGMYEESQNMFQYGTTLAEVQQSMQVFTCGDTRMVLDSAMSDDNFFVYNQQNPDSTKPCYSITFDKTRALLPKGYSRVMGSGRNICGGNPRQVERALEVKY